MYDAMVNKLLATQGLAPDLAEKARSESLKTGKPLPAVLIQGGYVPERELLDLMGEILSIPVRHHLDQAHVAMAFLEKVPREFARHHAIVALKGDNGALELATADPFDTYPMDEAALLLNMPVTPVVAPREKILSFISNAYDMDISDVDTMLGGLDAGNLEGITKAVSESEDLADMANKAPIVKLINTILFQALKQRASDVHIQPFERHVQVRFRIDGILYDVTRIPKAVQEAVVSRIKVMGRMDIAERRLPQDGQTSFIAGGREVDVRISTLPSANGERTVMRIQDKSTGLYDLKKIGLLESDQDMVGRLIRMAHGIILVTGPTGSGKTTTLYAALKAINSPDKNIITVEDPIEYQLEGISQVQVSNKKGMTFAAGLRSIVRQDPDVIMVGEIRDLETAGIAIQSALTGHLVFSTLHTNDAAGAVSRLIDLGVEPYLVNSSLLAVAAQRLVRRICENCREAYTASPDECRAYGLTPERLRDTVLYRARGCDLCQQTGYMGRLGIYEILQIDDALKALITQHASSSLIRKNALERGCLKTLRQDGIEKVLSGWTTFADVERVTQMDIE